MKKLVIQRKIIGTLRNGKGVFIYEALATGHLEAERLDPPQALSTALTNAWNTRPGQAKRERARTHRKLAHLNVLMNKITYDVP